MGERGLKLVHLLCLLYRHYVAPYGGAWIETYDYTVVIHSPYVAPYGGAWIETIRRGT